MKQKRYDKAYAKGSYTVEAAFIVPIVLGLVFTILYMTFLLHDKVVLQSNLQEVMYLLAEDQILCKEKEYQPYLQRALWFVELNKVDISEGSIDYSGTVVAKGRLEIPVLSIFMKKVQEYEVSAMCCKIQPEIVKRVRR